MRLILLSTLSIVCFASSVDWTIDRYTESPETVEDLSEISVEAVIISSSWKDGKPIHKYEIRIQNDSDVSICRVKVRINGHVKQFWNLETCKGSYRTPYWLELKPGAFTSQPGFTASGRVDIKLITAREC